MNLVQITPGAGGMYCGGCFRDNALVAALRRAGHAVTMVPLYLPLTLDEPDQSAGTPVFFGGVSVFLEQQSGLFRRAPRWLRRALAAPAVLRWAAGRAAKTRAADVGELTLSMLRGEEGRQARELEDLVAWLKSQPRPDVICLSNALLAGLARRLRRELGAPVACQLQGEDTFLDALPAGVREAAWRELAARAAEMDLLLAPSRYYAELMERRLNLPAGRVRVVFNGIDLDGYSVPALAPDPPVLGYFARMCAEKGLGTLVDAYLLLKQREGARALRVRVGGGCGPSDAPLVEQQRAKLARAGVLQDAEFFPNVDRAGKIRFLQSLSIFSTPALYGESFGLYVLEALAAGVPVVQPRHAAFPELIEATGGGVLCEPGDAKALADAIENLLLHPLHARHLGRRGREAVEREFSVGHMAARVVAAFDGMRR
jgi:glycosyltransferase involved in cell wall biosynthesis